MGRLSLLKQHALQMADRKLTGQKKVDAIRFIRYYRSESAIANLVKRLEALPDVEHDDQPFEPSQYSLWRADRAAGMTFRSIAEKYDQPPNLVYRIARDVEVTTPRPKGQRSDTGKTHQRKERSMATRKGDSLALVKRCEDAGWPVFKVTDGYRVRLPNGEFQGIHLTYSDINSLNACVRDLVAAGLVEAEQATAEKKQIARKAKLAADREAAERAAARLAERAKNEKAAVVKAAGGYLVEPETMPLSWFTDPHPAPQMRWVWMTPQIAGYLLDNHNKPGGVGKPGKNRPQSEATIRHYASIIAADQWRLTHQGMASDWTGMVQDGQHRQAAILLAAEILGDDLRVPVAYFVGMDPDNFKAIDEGLLRTAAQLFTMEGQKNAATLKSAIRLVIAYSENPENARNVLRRRNTNAQLLEAFDRNPEAFQAAARAGQKGARNVDGLNPGPYAAAHYLLYTANGPDNRFLDAFFHGLSTGTKMGMRELDGESYQLTLQVDDPRNVLRRTLTSIQNRQGGRSAPAMDQVGLIILAWNSMVEGRHRQQFTWPKDADIPRLLLCKDDVGSIPPRALTGEVEPREAEVGVE